MKLKMVGLGKMGFNLALNMKDHEVDVEGFDVNEEARKKAEESGIKSYETLKRSGICGSERCDLGYVTSWKDHKFSIR